MYFPTQIWVSSDEDTGESGLVNLLGPHCTSTRQGLEAQRNTLLRTTRSTTTGLSLQVCMAWCLKTILSLGSNRKSSLTQHSNAPWHRRLQILSIQTSPTFFNAEPCSVPRVPHRSQMTTALFSTGHSKTLYDTLAWLYPFFIFTVFCLANNLYRKID